MTTNHSFQDFEALKVDLDQLLLQLDQTHSEQSSSSDLICKSLASIVQIAKIETDRLDWKLIAGSLQDMGEAIATFHAYRQIRKVSIFGSSRILPHEPEYLQALHFAQAITASGFMVLTGAGNGIMAAGNEGAGCDRSFGLNIKLPFEQSTNVHMQECDRLVDFKYFFTRKLFFVRESDAIALFPGGYGTLDELFECLVLCQTGRSNPIPIVLIDQPGGTFWQSWDTQIQKHLLERGLIHKDDRSLYQITDRIEVACEAINNFYKIYHSCRRVDDLMVIRLNSDISDTHVDRLNAQFSDILVEGKIRRCQALEQELQDDDMRELPRLRFHFDFSSFGRLQDLIWAINQV
jgi:uncharacterized protein (TIGR00730 family)